MKKYAIPTLFIVFFLFTIYSYYNFLETDGDVYIFFIPGAFVFLGMIIDLKRGFFWVNVLWLIILISLEEYTKYLTDMSREQSYFILWILIPVYYILISFATKNKFNEHNKVTSRYDGILIALLAKIAKSDGQITQAEAKYLSEEIDVYCEATSTNRDIYKKIIDNEKDRIDNIESLCKELLNNMTLDNEDKLSIVITFVELGSMDGNYNNKEEIILKIIRSLDIDIHIYESVKEEYESKENSSLFVEDNPDLSECYKILESKDTDSLSTIKQNYRRLIRQYHPDSNVSKDLPQGMIDFAEKQTKLLNEAFERIKNVKF